MRPYCPKCEEPALTESASYCSQCGEELVNQTEIDREEVRKEATGLLPPSLQSQLAAAYGGDASWPSSPHDHIRAQEEIRVLLSEAVLLAAWTAEGFDISSALAGTRPTDALDDDEVIIRTKGHLALLELLLGRVGYPFIPLAIAVTLEGAFSSGGDLSKILRGDIDYDVCVTIELDDQDEEVEFSLSEFSTELGL